MNDLKILISADDKASATIAKVRGNLVEMQGDVTKLKGVLAGLGVSLSGAAAVAWVKNIAAGVDNLNDLKAATGATIGNLSALEDIALRNGIAMDVAGDAVLKLNKALNTASDPKSDAAAAIRALGLSVEDLKKEDPVEALRRIALALNGFADDGNKGRIVMTLLGKSTREVAPLLKELAEAGTLNAKVTEEQAAQAKIFSDNLATLHKNSLDLARGWVGQLLPAMNQVLEGMKSGGFIGAGDAIGEMIGLGKEYYANRNIPILTKDIANLQAELADLSPGKPYAAALQKQIDDKQAQLRAYRRDLEKAEEFARIVKGINPNENYGNEGRRQRPSLPGSPDTGDKKVKPIKADTTPDFDPYLAALKELEGTDIEKIKRLNATLEQLLQLQAAGMSGQGTAQAIDSVRAALEKLDPVVSRAKEAAKAIDELLGIGPDSGFSKKLDQLEELGRRLEGGLISPDAYIAALKQLDGDFAKTGEHIKDTAKDVGEEIGLVFSSAAGEAITKFQNLRSLLKGIAADILQIVYKRTIGKAIEDAIGSVFNGDATLASLFGSAKGNAFGPGGVLPFAMGGVVTSPTLFKFASGTGLMGEAGPEAILPLQRGSDGKLGVRSGGGGAVQVTYAPTINIDSRSDRAQVGALVAQAVAQGNQQMIQHLKAQGAL